MQSNRSIPPTIVIPELAYADVNAAADWLCNTFGFGVRLRIGDHRVQMNVPGGGAVVAIEADDHPANRSAVMVRVEDAHAHHERAKSHGAKITRPPQDYPYGERQYSAQDIGGHTWTFTQSIADVDPRSWGGQPEQLT